MKERKSKLSKPVGGLLGMRVPTDRTETERIMKPACPKCRLFYKIKKTGFMWEEGFPTGKRGEEVWSGYKLWAGDLFECRGCGAQVIVGVPPSPIAEHYQPDYSARRASIQPQVRIDDC